MDLSTIERKTKSFSTEHARLSKIVLTLKRKQDALNAKFLPAIKAAVKRTAEKKTDLINAIDADHSLFTKPRTVVFSGIKVGLGKCKGKVSFADGDKVVALIKKHFPDKQDLLINTVETPLKDGLSKLTGDDLKKLGVTITADSDGIVIKHTDSDVEKLVSALLKDIVAEGDKEMEAA